MAWKADWKGDGKMTAGDSLYGVPTIYKGVRMRSKLETKFAQWLDCHNIKWNYELITFRLSNGINYVPDFYLPELKTWVEVKGVIEEHNRQISKLFCEDNSAEMLLVSNENSLFYHWDYIENGKNIVAEDDRVNIGKCSKCNRTFFCGYYGSFHCRKCHTHEGDHDIWGVLDEDFVR